MHCIHLLDIDTCNKGGTTIGKIKGEFEYEPNKDDILYSLCHSTSCNFRDCPRYIAFLENKGYLFSWEDVPRGDVDGLLRFLVDDLDIDWAENAEIHKSDDDKTIRIVKDENSAEIKIDEEKEKATLKISDDRSHGLKVKKENGKLNIYNKGYKKIDIGGGVEASGERWWGKHKSCIYLSQEPDSKCCEGGTDEDNPSKQKRIKYCRTNFTACPDYQRFLAANLAGKEYKKNNIVDVETSESCKYYSKGQCKVGGKYEYDPQNNKRYGNELQNLCRGNFTDCPRYIAFLENGIE